jgi:hypothetical protein
MLIGQKYCLEKIRWSVCQWQVDGHIFVTNAGAYPSGAPFGALINRQPSKYQTIPKTFVSYKHSILFDQSVIGEKTKFYEISSRCFQLRKRKTKGSEDVDSLFVD